MNTTLTPNLMTEHVNQSVIFYRDRLGFRYGIRELWIRDNNGYLLALAEKPHQD